jgi:ABC-2 type transport system ATP-binding protein
MISSASPAASALAASSVPDPSAIVLDGLSVRLGGRPILHALTATLRGRAIGLLGPNGAGKSTLIQTLLGFHRPASGTARLLGEDIRRAGPHLRDRIGYMPENEAFIPGMSAVRFVRYMGELSGLPRAVAIERAHATLYYVGLGEARYREVQTFSLGMKQTAKLAQALVHSPRLIFLDEPTNGLDPRARSRMLDLIREIRDSGAAQVVLSSHLLRDVEQCCDEVLILRDGRVAAVCDLAAERRDDRSFLDLDAVGAVDAFSAALGRWGIDIDRQGNRLKLVIPDRIGVRELYALAAEEGARIQRLSYRHDSLEDIFLRAMESDLDARADESDGMAG